MPKPELELEPKPEPLQKPEPKPKPLPKPKPKPESNPEPKPKLEPMPMVFESLYSRRLIAKSFSRNQGDSRLYSDLWRLYSDFRRLIAEPQGSGRLDKSRLKNLADAQTRTEARAQIRS